MQKTLEQDTVTPPVSQDTAVDREAAADMLQNDISQTLAAVLLWLQSAMEDEQLAGNLQLQLAETNLRSSIKQLVRLHYALLQEL